MNTPVFEPRTALGLTPGGVELVGCELDCVLHTCVSNGLVNDFKEHSQLGVHGMRLFWVNPKHGRIKSGQVFQLSIASWETKHA